MSLTTKDVKNHLGIDYEDEMMEWNISRLIRLADKYLKGAVHEKYDKDDERAIQLSLQVIDDLYNKRGIFSNLSKNEKMLFEDMMLQLKLETVRKEKMKNGV